MIHNTCPCCGTSRLPHLADCTFRSDAPEAADDFDEVLGLRAEIASLRLTDAERMAVDMAILNCHQAGGVDGVRVAATLRSLLERTK
jgi:hypothetical protein